MTPKPQIIPTFNIILQTSVLPEIENIRNDEAYLRRLNLLIIPFTSRWGRDDSDIENNSE